MKVRCFEKISAEQWNDDVRGEEVYPVVSYENIRLPKRKTAMSAGYDVFSPMGFELIPNQEIMIPTGFKVYMQPTEFLMFVPRSGLGFKYYTRLANTVGIVDADYYDNSSNEGHCWIKMRNEGNGVLKINPYDGIAQVIFVPFLLVDGDNFNGETRFGGFGSTDKNN